MRKKREIRATIPSLAMAAYLLLLGFGVYRCAYKSTDGAEVDEGAATMPPFETVLHNVEEYRGKTVRWGGRIVEVVEGTHEAEFVVQHVPLDKMSSDTPVDYSKGRFVARGPHEVISASTELKIGTYIQIEGIVRGIEVKPVGKDRMAHPIIGFTTLEVIEVQEPSHEDYPDIE